MVFKRILFVAGIGILLLGIFNQAGGAMAVGALLIVWYMVFGRKRKKHTAADLISQSENTVHVTKIFFSGNFTYDWEYKVGAKYFAYRERQSMGISVSEFFSKSDQVQGRNIGDSRYKNLGTVKDCILVRDGENYLNLPAL